MNNSANCTDFVHRFIVCNLSFTVYRFIFNVHRPSLISHFLRTSFQSAHYEQIKRFTLLPEPFSMERGELTNTLKLKRSVVAKNYSEQIEKMYEENEK